MKTHSAKLDFHQAVRHKQLYCEGFVGASRASNKMAPQDIPSKNIL